MVVLCSIATNYRELYSEPTNNSFGPEEAERENFYEAVYEVWRATTRSLSVDVLLQNILADFIRPIGGIGVSVLDESSSTGLEYWSPYMGSPATQVCPSKLETG
jgi:hypothetical protein